MAPKKKTYLYEEGLKADGVIPPDAVIRQVKFKNVTLLVTSKELRVEIEAEKSNVFWADGVRIEIDGPIDSVTELPT